MNDTICAISSSLGIGAISIIRISGKSTLKIVNEIFSKPLDNEMSHTIHYGFIKDQDEIIDEVLVMLMLAPKTYTREDIIEINCHGGISTTQKIVELLLKRGCRMAEPGEFTKRAYLNGRINLLEAESVQDLIVAKTDASRIIALNNINGILSKKIKHLREKMVKLLANIEVNIDYPEYTDEVQITKELLEKEINIIRRELKDIVDGSKNGKMIKEGINVAIVGRPNVGKSSILNFLLDEEKAIVTNIPGTTRDIVEGSISLNGVQMNFLDTAGIRATDDLVEQIGVNKSKEVANNADMILFVLNNNEVLTKEERELLDSFDYNKVLVFVNKSDLDDVLDTALLEREFVKGNTIDTNGLDNLKQALSKRFKLEEIITKDMSYLSNIRQIDLVNKADESLENAYQAFLNDMPIDLIEIDLKKAWNYLGELIAEVYDDELVDNIFANFCLGK